MSTQSPNGGAPMFIVLEGIDGSGTSTQLDRLAARLRDRGRRVLTTREPSEGPIGRLLREILRGGHANPDGTGLDGRAMALLFAADRRDHLTREIEPALAGGADVISDRYLLSSLAYQAVEADRAWVEQLAAGVRQPDLTLFLDVEIGVAARRRLGAGRPVERYDADGTLARVAANYRRLAVTGANIVRVDGTPAVSEVEDALVHEVDLLLARRRLTAP
jgi:dTMP kinase